MPGALASAILLSLQYISLSESVGPDGPERPPGVAAFVLPSGLHDSDQQDDDSGPGTLLPPLSLDEGRLHDLLQQTGPTSRHLETEHFCVVYAVRRQAARDLAGRLETVYQAHVRFSRETRLPVLRPKHKLEILLLADYASFEGHLKALGQGAADMLGCYDPRANRCVFFDLDTYPPLVDIRAALEQAEPEQREKLRQRLQRRYAVLALGVIQHEAAHQIQCSIGLLPELEKVPPWLAEGLATLFEVPFDQAGRPRESINAYRLFEFKKLYGSGPQSLPNLGRLLTDDRAWCGGKCYPAAWAVLRYLRDEQGDGFTALLRKVATDGGLPAATAERRAVCDELFGPVDERWIGRVYEATMRLSTDGPSFAD